MTGRIAVLILLISGLAAGVLLWVLQMFVEYESFEGAQDGFGPVLNISGQTNDLTMSNIEGIQGTSSPLKFRACFQVPMSPKELENLNRTYSMPIPITAPDWFDCYDATEIGADLENGLAKAFLIQQNIANGVDLVAALYPDGRGFAWRQINTR